jgi:signal recognition particle subunit SEC65
MSAPYTLSEIERKPVSAAALEKPTLESLTAEVRELRAAVERNGGNPGTPWEAVEPTLDLD